MNKSKHAQITYETLKQTKKSINSPYFKDADKFGEIYEVQKRKRVTKQNMPIQISSAILSYAKLMLEFYYDFLNKFVDRSDMNMMYMDTDSCYMAITADKFEDIIKPDMREVYENEKNLWFPRTDTETNLKYDTRTPGLFKVEFSGDGMVCLCPKLYYCLGDQNNKNKFSSKGVQKNNNSSMLNYKNFKEVLHKNLSMYVENTGMRYINGEVVWYSTYKTGLTTKYNKRKVMSDLVSTAPLEEHEYI